MNKALSCFLSFLPAILVFGTLILFAVFGIVAGMEGTMGAGETIFMIFLLVFEFIGVILALVMIVWYMIKACKNPNLSTGMKVVWCFLIYSFNLFIFPVYWFIYIRKEY